MYRVHTVKLLVEHVFSGVTCARYEELFFDEEFNRALGEELQLGRELVKLERTPGRIVRHVRCEPKREAGSPADQAFGKSRAGFFEELEYDTRTRRATWKTIPNVFTKHVSTTGTLELVDVPGGVKRVMRGDVKVSFYGFGKIIEKMIVAEIEKSQAANAVFTTRWLAR